MYLEFFNLIEKPFNYLIPDPRYFFYSPQSQSIKNQCDYIVSEKGGHLFISGPIGAGKTTLLKTITQNLLADDHNTVNFVNAPNLKTANSLMRRVSEGFKVKTERSYDATLQNFTEWLKNTDRFPILIIDEGQNLVRDSLKTLHYLMTYVTDKLLMMIILCGQEEMVTRIDRFPEIRSRMFPASLSSLSREEAEEMMRFRWTVAGGKDFPFDKQAIAEVYRLTGGIARDICKLANESLLRTMVEKRNTVDKDIVLAAAADAFAETR